MIHFLFEKRVLLLKEVDFLHRQCIPLVHLIYFLDDFFNLTFVEIFLHLRRREFLF